MTNQGSRFGLVDLYVAFVAFLALGLSVLVYFNDEVVVPHSKLTYVVIFCVLLFIGESRPKFLRFVDGGQVTPGWAFAFSIVLLGAPLIAIAAMSACGTTRSTGSPPVPSPAAAQWCACSRAARRTVRAPCA